MQGCSCSFNHGQVIVFGGPMRSTVRAVACASTLVFSTLLVGCGSSLNPRSTFTSASASSLTVTAVAEQVNGVAPNRKQEVQFSAALNPSTVNASTFLITDASGKAVSGVVSYDPVFNLAIFQPRPVLQMMQKYTATLTTGIADQGGDHLAAAYTYSFQTRSSMDTSPISVLKISPASDATCVASTATVTITFDEEPDATTLTSSNIVLTGPGGAVIPTRLSMDVSATQVIVTPVSALPSGQITVTVKGVGDLADTLMTQPFVSTFSTACAEGSGATAYLYVTTQNPSTPNSSQIQAYSVASNGSLSPVPGSPYSIPQPGTLGVAGSDLFYLNEGAGTIQAYTIGSDGSLTQSAATMPRQYPAGTSSEGPVGLSFDTTGQSLYPLYLINDAYQSFAIGSGGALSFLGYTYGSSPESDTDLSFTTNDRYAYDSSCFRGTPNIAGYTRSSNGLLTKTYEPAPPPQPAHASGVYCPYGAAVAGDSYVVIAETPTNDITSTGPTQLVVYNINSNDGSLSTTNTSSSATMANTDVRVYRFDPTQKYLAVGGTDGVHIFGFANGVLTAVGTFPIKGGVASLRWDDSGHLFVIGPGIGESGTGYLYVFNMVAGVPTPAPGSPVTVGVNGFLAVKTLQ